MHAPALFVLGEEDRMTSPRAAQSLRDAMPQARVLTLPCGHAMMDEDPAAVAAALTSLARNI